MTGGKILYVNKRFRAHSSSKKSRLKRVHLLFDDDGNAVDANSKESTVTQRVKSFLQAVNVESSVDRMSSSKPVEDGLETAVCDERQNLCGNDKSCSAGIVDSAELCSHLLTVVDMDTSSSCQDGSQTAAAADVESEDSDDESSKEADDDIVCDSDVTVNTSCTVANVASNDAELHKYWWQRYRLFSRFDSGIMIDRGCILCCCLIFVF